MSMKEIQDRIDSLLGGLREDLKVQEEIIASRKAQRDAFNKIKEIREIKKIDINK